jgi:hypothetical protein
MKVNWFVYRINDLFNSCYQKFLQLSVGCVDRRNVRKDIHNRKILQKGEENDPLLLSTNLSNFNIVRIFFTVF